MHPLVFILLAAALVLVILALLMGPRDRLLIAAAVVAVLAIILHLFVFAPRAGAGEPPGPYDVPPANPQPPRAIAQGIPAGAVIFTNGTNTAPPSCIKALVPSVNPATRVILCAIVARPEGGGSLHLLHLYTADGVQATIDLTAYSGYEDCFGGEPEISDFTSTIKVFANCKRNDTGNGNDRIVFPVDSGLEAHP